MYYFYGQLAFGSFKLVLNTEVFVLHPEYGESTKRGSTVITIITQLFVFVLRWCLQEKITGRTRQSGRSSALSATPEGEDVQEAPDLVCGQGTGPLHARGEGGGAIGTGPLHA